MWSNIIQHGSYPNQTKKINKYFKEKTGKEIQTDLIFIKEEIIEE